MPRAWGTVPLLKAAFLDRGSTSPEASVLWGPELWAAIGTGPSGHLSWPQTLGLSPSSSLPRPLSVLHAQTVLWMTRDQGKHQAPGVGHSAGLSLACSMRPALSPGDWGASCLQLSGKHRCLAGLGVVNIYHQKYFTQMVPTPIFWSFKDLTAHLIMPDAGTVARMDSE